MTAQAKTVGRFSHMAGYSRPAPFGEWERGFVEQKRAVRASWADIAKMLGRSEEDVRRKFDPAWSEPPRARIRIARVDLGLRSQQMTALSLLLTSETLTREALSRALYGNTSANPLTLNSVVSQLRTALGKHGVAPKGLATAFGEGWKLTPKARERLAELGWVATPNG